MLFRLIIDVDGNVAVHSRGEADAGANLLSGLSLGIVAAICSMNARAKIAAQIQANPDLSAGVEGSDVWRIEVW